MDALRKSSRVTAVFAVFAALAALGYSVPARADAAPAAAAVAATAGLTACGDENEFPPYSYFVRHDGVRTSELAGYSVEYLATMARLSGRPIRLMMLPWARCLWMAERGEVDFAIDVVNVPERAERFALLGPYYRIDGIGYLYRKDYTGTQPHSAIEFSRQVMCVPLGYTFNGIGERQGRSVHRPATYGQAYKMLRAGRCDVIPTMRSMLHAGRKLGMEDPREQGDVLFQIADWVPKIDMYFAVGKTSPRRPGTEEFLTHWTRQMRERGETARLRRAHGME